MEAKNPVVPLPVKPSVRPGMGTSLYDGGVTFRVWAPFASRLTISCQKVGVVNGFESGGEYSPAVFFVFSGSAVPKSTQREKRKKEKS
jgi:hypothetical protein